MTRRDLITAASVALITAGLILLGTHEILTYHPEWVEWSTSP